MKKLAYILILLVLSIACNHQKSKEKDWSAYIAPDSVWDYSYVDSIKQAHIAANANLIYYDEDSDYEEIDESGFHIVHTKDKWVGR